MRLSLISACFVMAVLAVGKNGLAQEGSSVSSYVIFSTATQQGAKLADSTRSYTIRNIYITGNKRTHPDIILRELPFSVNENYSIEAIRDHFAAAKKLLMNTGLFRGVVVTLQQGSDADVFVNITVDEKWYVWPKPYLRTVDKTFHQWWNEKNRNMNRINYGMKITHNNFTGRNDKLKVNFMNGYTRQLSVQYYGLFLDNELKWSINGGFWAGKNREVNYMTQEDKLVSFKHNDDYLRTYFSWFAEVNYRPAIKTTHSLGMSFNYENVADTVSRLNPDFYSGHRTIRYPEMQYKMSYFDVDFIPYPTRGFIGEVILRRRGINSPVNLWQLTAKGSKTWPINQNYFFNASAVGMVKLPLKQPYVGRQFIGHENQYLQGYEYYVIDGVAGAYSKATLTRRIVKTNIGIPSKRFPKLNTIPLKIYAKTFLNAGYVYNHADDGSRLSNSFLYSGGVGFDIVVFTDFVVKIEWSFNRLGENGLYLHKRNCF